MKHSINHALINITENIRSALDNKNFACGVFVDLQKAFDTVNHNIILDKLAHYGIRGVANEWFTSYLSNRKQYVSILGFDSEIKSMPHGVPQGSVLGPLLFLIYINDLHAAIKHSKVYHFADDTNLLNIGSSCEKMQKQINLDLKSLYKWLLANKISLNCSKTEIIFFHKPGQLSPDLKIKINGNRIFPSKYIKYLGIYLDETLSFSHHCNILAKKLTRANGMLCIARHYIPKDELKSIYHAIFSSHMIFGSQIWGQSCNTHTKNVFKLQNRALRIINFADFRANSNPLYNENIILKLGHNIELQNCLFVHDFLNNKLPTCFADYFNKSCEIHQLATRNSELGCLFVPYFSTSTYGLKSITRKCIDAWNFFTKAFNCNLLHLSRHSLKHKLTSHFIESYK